MLPRNEGPLDRILRSVAGTVLLPLGLFVLGGLEGEILGLVVAAFGVIGLVTAATGFCPAYVLFHFSTLRGRDVGTSAKKEVVPR